MTHIGIPDALQWPETYHNKYVHSSHLLQERVGLWSPRAPVAKQCDGHGGAVAVGARYRINPALVCGSLALSHLLEECGNAPGRKQGSGRWGAMNHI